MNTQDMWVVASAVTFATMGCTTVLGIDKDYREVGRDGETGGSTSGSNGSGNGMVGSSGATVHCNGNQPCQDDNACTNDVCNMGVCEYSPLDGISTPGYVDTPGDCSARFCVNGADTLVGVPNDVPDDGEECTIDGCANGTPTHGLVADGTACNANTGARCAGGKCSCPGTLGQVCAGHCKDLASDHENCGTCGQTCAPDTTGIRACGNGTCKNLSWADWPMPNPPIGGLPNPQFYTIDAARDVVTDEVTHLMWQRTADDKCYTWDEANAYCANLVHGGQEDWRLPTRIELVAIVDFTRSSPAVDPTAFPYKTYGVCGMHFWTSSPRVADDSSHWVVNFDYGEAGTVYFGPNGHARCVR